MKMIVKKTGDLLSVVSSMERALIIQGANAQGIQGKGLAKQIKEEFPMVFEQYRDTYEKQGNYLELGDVIPVVVNNATGTMICNGITQNKYAKSYLDKCVYADYDAIEHVFSVLNQIALDSQYTSIHFPLIGCGLANGDWGTVEKIIDRTIDDSITKVLWTLE